MAQPHRSSRPSVEVNVRVTPALWSVKYHSAQAAGETRRSLQGELGPEPVGVAGVVRQGDDSTRGFQGTES